MSTASASTAPPADADVRAALRAIVASPAFATGAQLADVLTYLVERTLAGEASQLKAYAIAVDAMGRDADFDPQTSAAVRVAVGRLRQALALYNSEPNEDAAVITLSRGTYVPVFQKAAAKRPTREPASARLWSDFGWLFGVLAVVLVAALAAGLAMQRAGLIRPSGTVQAVPELSAEDANRKPSIDLRLDLPDDDYPQWFNAGELADAMSTVAGRFGDYRTGPTVRTGPFDPPIDTLHNVSADYVMRISAHASGTSVRFFASLLRGKDGEMIWSMSRTLDRPSPLQRRDTEAIVGSTFAPLGSPNGLIYADMANGGPDRHGLRCIAAASAYFVRETREHHRRARACAEQLVDAGTRLAGVYAALTFLYLDEAREGFNRRPRDPYVAARAMAERAVQVAPLSARAHQAMFASHKVGGRRAAAHRSARQAVRLNPYDTDIAADYAAWLISIGETADARTLLRFAEPLMDVQPSWFVFARFVEAELSDEPDRAAAIVQDVDFTHAATLAMATVIGATRSGNVKRARAAYEHLKLVAPRLASSTQHDLKMRGFDEAVAARISLTFNAARQAVLERAS